MENITFASQYDSPKWLLVKWADRTRAVIEVNKVIANRELIAHDINPSEDVFCFGDILTIRTEDGLRKGLFMLGSDSREELLEYLNTVSSFREHPRDDSAETSEDTSNDGASGSDLSNTDTINLQSEEESATICSACEPVETTIENNGQTEKTISEKCISTGSNNMKETKTPKERSMNMTERDKNNFCECTITSSKNFKYFPTCNIHKHLVDSRGTSNTADDHTNRLGHQIRCLICSSDKKKTGCNTCSQLNRKHTLGQTYIIMKMENNNTYNKPDDSTITTSNRDDSEVISVDDEFNRSDDDILITNKNGIILANKENIKPSSSRISVAGQDQRSNRVGKLNKRSKTSKQKLVPIGHGNTWIAEDLSNKLKHYPSYTAATRTLLRALFSRRVLATHSLSGKPSPAFKNRPVKMILNPRIIKDIIKEIDTNFQDVDKKLIKTAITSTCADEAKAYRRSINNKKNAKDISSADESSHE